MKEMDALNALSALGDVSGTHAAIFFSVTFAYVSVAYLVGSSLSRFQCLAVSTLYLLASSIFGASTIGYSDAWLLVKAQETTPLDQVWIFNNFEWLPVIIVVVVGVPLLSLYFMYDVRKSIQLESNRR
jgi:hypothetical protein